MKNALITGGIIGLLSALWLFILRWTGYSTENGQTAPFEYAVVAIPIIGLYLGVLNYKKNEKNNQLSFFEALL